jgi:hypothetical protein
MPQIPPIATALFTQLGDVVPTRTRRGTAIRYDELT